MIFEIPFRNFFAGREPNVRELLCVFDEFANAAGAERLTDDMRMQSQVHQAAAIGAFAIQGIELFLEQVDGLVGGVAAPHKDHEVVRGGRMRE